MNPSSSTSFSVGFVCFVATVVTVGGLFSVGSGGGFFEDQVQYTVLVPSTSGLRSGSRVYLSGVPVGTVSSIDFPEEVEEQRVLVTLSVDRKVVPRIRSDSVVWLQSEGLLGDMSVQVSAGSVQESPLDAHARIEYRGRSPLEGLAGEEIAHSATSLLENTIELLETLNRGQGTIGKLFANPELYDNLNRFTSSMNELTSEVAVITREMNSVLEEIRAQRGTLGKLIFSPEYEAEFTKALRESTRLMEALGGITETLASGKGFLGRLLEDPALYDRSLALFESVSQASSKLASLLGEAERSQSALGRLLTDPATGEKLASLLGRLEQSAGSIERILAMVERGEGSLGILVRDPSIALSARDLFVGVQESALVENMVRNVEARGREIWLRDSRLSEDVRRQLLRARALAKLRERTGTEPSSLEAGARPVPATVPATEKAAAPAPPGESEENATPRERPSPRPEPPAGERP